ncbi:MAG: hypothetical protein MIO92_13555 [Methanosarcinaceae archaeon]|nr:hypothetical protein [Methanosarcinaceae archaeon]
MDNCVRAFFHRLVLIENLGDDIRGEEEAILQYQKHIASLSDPSLAKYRAKLEEILKEEIHHKEELQQFYSDRWFGLERALEDFADCECASRGNQVAASAKVSQIKIQGRNPHAR